MLDSPKRPTPPPLKCLIAEDDPAMRSWLRLVIGRLGVTTFEAASGWAMITLLIGEPGFDLVISDVRMPRPDGLEILSIARNAGFEAPFLLITAFPDEQTKERAAALRATVLEKPFTAAQLISAVEGLRRERLRLCLG